MCRELTMQRADSDEKAPSIPGGRRFLKSLGLCATILGSALGCAAPAPARAPESPSQEQARLPSQPGRTIERRREAMPHFELGGRPFCFQGANNYYLHYLSRSATLDVLSAAQSLGLSVLRTWAFLDRGSLDGSVRNVHGEGSQNGVHFQAWDPERKRPVYNDGPDGLERLDFVLHEARERGLKLILALTNNWRDFGGMDQYLVYFGLEKHHEFFTDARVKSAYKDWVAHLLQRTNSIDGVPYAEDPAIFAWELANEPRAINMTEFDAPDGWDTSTITSWADEMSSFIRSLDPNHLISVGDEGFLSQGGSEWVYEAPFGVDSRALTSLPHIDFGTFHFYPDHWGLPAEFGADWIEQHQELASRLDKPYLLEEYGLRATREKETEGPIVRGGPARASAYAEWNEVVRLRGGPGALFWNLSADMEPGRRYPDYDRFTLYPDEARDLITPLVKKMQEDSVACSPTSSEPEEPSSAFVRVRRVGRGAKAPD